MANKGSMLDSLNRCFANTHRKFRSRRSLRLEFFQLEDRCLLTAIAVPADVWPIAQLVPGQFSDLWYGRLSSPTIGYVSSQGDVTQVNTPSGTPQDLQTDAFGNLWFRTADAAGSLNRLTPAGSLTTLTNLGPVAARVSDLATPPASYLPRLLFDANGVEGLVGVSSTGAVSLVAAPATADTTDLRDARGALPVVRAADGAFWYPDGGGVARLTADGDFRRFALPPGNGNSVATIGVGPDGNLWFVEAKRDPLDDAYFADKLGRLTLDGTLTEVSLSPFGERLKVSGFTADASNNLWFDQQALQADGVTPLPGGHRVGRVGAGGTVTYYVTPVDDGTAQSVGIGPGGQLWTNTPFPFDFTNEYTTDVEQVSLATLVQDADKTITFATPAAPTIRPAADSYVIQHGNTLAVAAPGVLGNDLPGGAAPLAAALVSGPAHGSVTLNANGSLDYAPAAGFQGTDTFPFQSQRRHHPQRPGHRYGRGRRTAGGP